MQRAQPLNAESAAPCPCTYGFPKLCESCGESESCPISELFRLLDTRADDKVEDVDISRSRFKTKPLRPFHAADFLAHKNGQNYLVEVKTNRERDKIAQNDTLRHMQRRGLEPIIVNVTIPLGSSTFKIRHLTEKR